MAGVGHVQDGPRPAATEVGPGGTLRGAGRLLPPSPPPAPRCPGAQQSGAFRAKTHALSRLSSPSPARESSSSGFSRQLAGPTATERAGQPLRTQLFVYVNKALCGKLQPACALPTQPSPPPPRGNAAKGAAARWSPAAGRLLPPLALRRSSAGPLRWPAGPPARCPRLRPARLATHTRALPAPA